MEIEVEKELITARNRLKKFGLEPFIDKCKESVWKYEGMWEDFSKTVGFWADMEHPYVTYHDDFIESEWWALKQIWDKGPSLQGLQGGSLLSALRNAAFFPMRLRRAIKMLRNAPRLSVSN